jgi:hypothetical protein
MADGDGFISFCIPAWRQHLRPLGYQAFTPVSVWGGAAWVDDILGARRKHLLRGSIETS